MAIANLQTMTNTDQKKLLERLDADIRIGRVLMFQEQDNRKTARWYLCSRCWGDLSVVQDPQSSDQRATKVVCSECGASEMYISRKTVERREMEDHANFLLAKQNLRALLPQFNGGKSAADILKEI